LVEYSGKWYLATPVYFAEDPDDADLLRTISCHALIESSDKSAVVPLSEAVAVCRPFREKIAACDVEGLAPDSLVFVGFEDITVIEEDVTQGGTFLFLVREFETMRQIRALRIKEEKLSGFFEGWKDPRASKS
jgi:hypothetical protein